MGGNKKPPLRGKIQERNILSGISIEDFQRVFGVDGTFQKVYDAIKLLDTGNTWDETYNKLNELLNRCEFKPIKSQINERSKKDCGQHGCVYLDATYNNGVKVVVKVTKLKNKLVETFFECLVNMIVAKQNNEHIMAPKIYQMGRYNGELAIVQEKLEGEPLPNLSETDLREALVCLCKGLEELQKNEILFSHRDLHSGNLMYKKKIFLLDFGYSCVTLKNTFGSIQFKEPGGIYGPVDSSKKCDNAVHDVCHLLLNLRMKLRYPWLIAECQKICNLYLVKQVSDPDVTVVNDIGIVYGVKPSWEQFESRRINFFHPWYMYKLYDVNIDLTLENIRNDIAVQSKTGGFSRTKKLKF